MVTPDIPADGLVRLGSVECPPATRIVLQLGHVAGMTMTLRTASELDLYTGCARPITYSIHP
jgi:hypothetical protein